jgi:Plasmid pRiA4b ORF-3-like protein
VIQAAMGWENYHIHAFQIGKTSYGPSGGAYGFEQLKELLAGPPSAERDEMRDWAGGDYDPARFDLAAANAALGMSDLISGRLRVRQSPGRRRRCS